MKQRMMRRHVLAASAIGLTMGGLAGANATETTQDAGMVLISGSRMSPGLGQAIGATTITADDIAASTVNTLADVLDRLGGVTVRRNLNGSDDASLDLRGFGMTGNQNTLVLVDGQRISDNELSAARISAIPLAAIERIEILRGGGAVSYGAGTTGGVINIITRAPVAGTTTGYVSGLIGSLDTRELRGGVNLGIDRLAVSLNVVDKASDNWRKNNHTSNYVASAEARLNFAAGHIALRYVEDEQTARLPGERSQAQLRTDPRGTAKPNDFADSEANRASVSGEYRIGEVRLAVDLATRAKTARSDLDYSGTFGAGTYSRGVVRADEDSVSPRLDWQTRWGSVRNALEIGLDKRRYGYTNNATSDFGFGASSTLMKARQSNDAYYVRDQLTLPFGTELSAGARRERVEQVWRELVTPLPQRSLRDTMQVSDWAIRQRLGAGFSANVRAGRSFRFATVDENACFGAPCSAMLKPQKSRDRSLGVDWQGNDNSAGIEWFASRVEDEIYYNNLGFANVNMPPMQRKGLHANAQWRPLSTLELKAHYTRIHARFIRGIFAGVDVAGEDVPNVPKQRLTLQGAWQFLDTSSLVLAHSYVGAQSYDNDPAGRFSAMPSYGLTDIKLSHRMKSATLNLGVNNVFDKAYYGYAIVNSSTAPTRFNAYPEAGRTVFASLDVKF